MKDGLKILAGTFVGLIAASRLSKAGSAAKAVYTKYNCPITPAEVVDWTTENWWHPTPMEEITWQQFKNRVELEYDPEDWYYLPWRPDWSSWDEFQNRSEPEDHESFYKGALPSGQEVHVWQAGGVEHFYTDGGIFNPEHEAELILQLEDILDELQEREDKEITLEDTLREVQKLRKSGSAARKVDDLFEKVHHIMDHRKEIGGKSHWGGQHTDQKPRQKKCLRQKKAKNP